MKQQTKNKKNTERILDVLFWEYYKRQLKKVLFLDSSEQGESLANFIAEPRSAQETALQFEWSINATERFMKALNAFGLVIHKRTKYQLINNLEKLSQDLDFESHQWFESIVKKGRTLVTQFPKNLTKTEVLSFFVSTDPPEFVKHEIEAETLGGLVTLAYDQLIISQFFSEKVILQVLKSGTAQLGLALGLPTNQIFDHYLTHGSILNIYSAAFSVINEQANSYFSGSFRLSERSRILDIGGGVGGLAFSLVKSNPTSSATIYDHPSSKLVLESLQSERVGSHPNISRAYGDFFNNHDLKKKGLDGISDSEKFNAILLGWILHDWDSAGCVEILKKSSAHLTSDGFIAVFEKIMDEKSTDRKASLDFLMLAMAGGKERTLKEYKKVFKEAGLKVSKTIRNPEKGRDVMILRRFPKTGLAPRANGQL